MNMTPGSRPRNSEQLSVALLIAALLVTGTALAESAAEPETHGPLSWNAALEAGFAAFTTRGASFGAGREDLRTGETSSEAHWSEGYLKPSVTAESTGEAGTFYGEVSAVGAFTRGLGDPGGYTHSGDGSVDAETALLGWRSPGMGDGKRGVALSYGRQTFKVGDGFLIEDGDLDQFEKGAYWLAPRSAFRRAAVVNGALAPWRADLFHLKSDRDQDHTEIAGINIELLQDAGTFGVMYLHVTDAGPPLYFEPRAGMNVYDVRANNVTPLPWLADFTVGAEYAAERGHGRGVRFDASGWYVQAQYAFSGVAWTPTLAYRYSRFSGDADPGDDVRKDFDPLFYGSGESWGTWYQGEITGEYLLFNSNQATHMVHLSAYPTESVSLGVLLYHFDLAVHDYYGTPVAERGFADEVNLYLDWTVNEQVAFGVLYGAAFPGPAAREAFGDDRRFQLLEAAVYLTF